MIRSEELLHSPPRLQAHLNEDGLRSELALVCDLTQPACRCPYPDRQCDIIRTLIAIIRTLCAIIRRRIEIIRTHAAYS